VEKVLVDILGLSTNPASGGAYALILREVNGNRRLPIIIGASEAQSIALEMEGIKPPRPLTHDLMKDLITAFGRRLEEVRIIAIRDNVFHAELVFDGGLTVGSRSSDAIALALRVGCRIVGADEVLEAGGVAVPDEDDNEDEVEKFREFLDQISPEDFGEGAAGGESTSGGSES